ncbi:MAG: type II secretion system protein GspD [Flexistipes sinusarabici]|uniref:Type II secretion system protein GspD n=1 Tax=Flexistipes sinusarabici TaxID=2352 RepID=A0A5D0MJQ1_FLESI|nr:type II secretion system secretin GspD [Flexistipes sinusarabici]TYB32622.1 MAG: type II secretion system protein GspD [Flexistipes sinusarabici]
MKKLSNVLIIMFIVLLLSSAVNAQINVNLKNVSLKDFVQFVGEFTGKSIVYDEKMLKGNVSIDSQAKMNKKDLMEIFYTVLNMNNLYAVNKDDYIQILQERDLQDYPDKFVKNPDEKSKDFITSVITVEGIDLTQVAASVARLKSRLGHVQPVKGINALVIRDSSDRVNKITNVIESLKDVAGNMNIEAIQIENTTASVVLQNVKDFFNQLKAQSMTAMDPVLIADDMSNVLIAAATDNGMKKIKYIVSKLDSEDAQAATSPKVFYLKNAVAADVEEVLNKLLGSIQDPKTKNVVKSNVASDKATNSIIVVGDSELYDKVEKLISKLDVSRKQVYVEALIIETTLERGSNFGIEWLAGGGNENFAGSVGYLNNGAATGLMSPVLEGNSPNFSSMPGGFSASVLGDVITYEGVKFPTLTALVNFVKSASGINILSNPQILTLDNEEAEIFVGENRPFITSTKFDSNNNPVQSYDYRDVGVKLNIQPHISSESAITLEIKQEVKKVISNASVDAPAPITLTRRTNTTVKLKNSSKLVISGLIKDDSDEVNSAVPGLSKIPLIGWLFKSKEMSSQKTNLMVFITAKIISTQSQAKDLTEEKFNNSKEYDKKIEEQMREEY